MYYVLPKACEAIKDCEEEFTGAHYHFVSLAVHYAGVTIHFNLYSGAFCSFYLSILICPKTNVK